MKTKYILLILALCLSTSNLLSQEIDILGAIQENADLYNEQRGTEDDSNDNTQPSEEDRERFDEWWKDKLKGSADFLNELDDPNHHCMALISLYVYHFKELDKEIAEEQNCKMKYDLYGMMSLMIFSGTTIMPCTEGIYNLEGESKSELMEGFLKKFVETCDGDAIVWTDFAAEHSRTSAKIIFGLFETEYCSTASLPSEMYHGSLSVELTEVLEKYFHPKSITKQLFHISQEMEALGCGG